MNQDLDKLHTYPFEKLSALLAPLTPADKSPIALSIGEPKHKAPELALSTLVNHLDGLGQYPKTAGSLALRQAIANWLVKRFKLSAQSENLTKHILPVNGSREGLFSLIQAVVDRTQPANVIMPNPFYQIYEGGAILAGATPVYLNTTKANGYLPDPDTLDEQTLKDCQMFIICSPGNPTGAVMKEAQLTRLITLADQYDFVLVSDECYSEVYFDGKAPTGLLEVCEKIGRTDFKRCIVFNSLSKRSNLPGLRSGFVAGDAGIIKSYLLYRTYHGCAMPNLTQATSQAVWQDEQHVEDNRSLYREKFDAVLAILGDVLAIERPEAAFFLWVKLPDNDLTFAKKLYEEENVIFLPGQYLSRTAEGLNPGEGYARMALVAPKEACIEAANRIKSFVLKHYPKD